MTGSIRKHQSGCGDVASQSATPHPVAQGGTPEPSQGETKPADGVAGDRPPASLTGTEQRRPDQLFDYVNVEDRRGPAPERPGYLGAIVRGAGYRPVFGEGDNWLTSGLSDAGNWILDAIGDGASGLLHSKLEHGAAIPVTEDLVVAFSAGGRKLREDEIPAGDPRRLAIAELRSQHPGAIPLWIEGDLGQNAGFNIGHSIPIGASGGSVKFGFSVEEAIGFSAQRLLFVPARGKDLPAAAAQVARIALSPLDAGDVSRMETGATYRFSGHARFRLDAALGLGLSVPAIGRLLRVGASVEVGAFGSLGGEFSLEMQRMEHGRARLTLTSLGTASSGAQLKILAGVAVSHTEVSRLLRGFVDFVADGGDPAAFASQLSNERERELAKDLGGYLRLLVKNLADGTGTAVIDHLVGRYATAYLEARGGIDIASNFSTEIDFDMQATNRVELPRADMVPESMRGGTPADQPLAVEAGRLARLAYDMVMRGDLRLVQHLTLVRGSGVRVNDTQRRETTGTSREVDVELPFIHYRDALSTSGTVIDRFAPELGRTRTAISEFDREYRSIFGSREDSSAQVTVHAPAGKEEAEVFFASNDNFSADFVVQNKVEPWTSYADMQDFVGVLNLLSNGRLESRVREALGTGEYRDDSAADDLNIIHRLFFEPREYGRTIAHMHVWLGEAGLRHLLASDAGEDELYAAIGRAFADLDPSGGTELPAWATPGASRKLPRRRRAGYRAHDYDVGPTGHDLKTAKYLVDNILRLRQLVAGARTPAAEERAAVEIRGFLRDARDKLPAYAALASLVPEKHRAVEMRLTAIRKGKAPIRFTYVQDGRASDLLYATGFARAAMKQLQRFAVVLDAETRVRIGKLLGEMHDVLGAPSPDPYRLRVTMRSLELELGLMDRRVAAVAGQVARDIGFARAFLDTLPASRTIQAVLPGPVGAELATIRFNTLRELNAPQPNLEVLRATFRSLVKRMPQLRRIESVSSVVESVARLANELAASYPEAAGRSRVAVESLRRAIREKAPDDRFDRALERVTASHTELLRLAGDAAGTDSSIVEERLAGSATPPADAMAARPADLARARREEAQRHRALAGNPDAAPLSYFERTGVVPPHFMATPYRSGGDGIVTGSMVRAADLAMATSRPSQDLGLPALAQKQVNDLVVLARAGDADGFLARAEELRFVPEPVLEDPRRKVVEIFLAEMQQDQLRAWLEHVGPNRRGRIERIRAEMAARRAKERREPSQEPAEREQWLRDNPRYADDLRYARRMLADDPGNLQTALDNLGYGRSIDTWHTQGRARLDAVLSQLTGDELDALARKMDAEGRGRFLDLVRRSDLKPQTRARLAGQIVDDTFFWHNDEELVEALATGMNAADLRIFFDTLHVDGKLEDFLEPKSFWALLLTVLTFGLARLFLHDNEAALRVIAAQGWSADELMAEYSAQPSLAARIDRAAETVWFESTVDTIPMDPQVRGALRVLHNMLGNVKIYHFADLPDEAGRVLASMATGAGKQLAKRLADIAEHGGSTSEILAEYEKFLQGLSRDAVAQQLETGDTDGSVAVISKALADGAVAGLIEAARDPKNRFITHALLVDIIHATNNLDSPVSFEADGYDPRVDQASYDQLVEKAAFYSAYSGFDFSQVDLMVGGLATAAPAVAFGNSISIAPDQAPMIDGRFKLSDSFQQVIAFHETSHVLQQMIYGARVNSFIDQAIHIQSSGDRGGAYRVDQAMFDRATSIHAFQEHWEQQAELLERALRLLWARSVATGSKQEAVYEAYPGPGHFLDVAGGRIELTPERWQKMVRFVHEFGDAARTALGRTGGRFEFQGTRDVS